MQTIDTRARWLKGDIDMNTIGGFVWRAFVRPGVIGAVVVVLILVMAWLLIRLFRGPR